MPCNGGPPGGRALSAGAPDVAARVRLAGSLAAVAIIEKVVACGLKKFIKWHKGMVEWFQKITGWDDYTLLWFAFLEGVILTLLLGYIL